MKTVSGGEIVDLFLAWVTLCHIELADANLSSNIEIFEILFAYIVRRIDMVGLVSLNLGKESNLRVKVKRSRGCRRRYEQTGLDSQNRLISKTAWNTPNLLDD